MFQRQNEAIRQALHLATASTGNPTAAAANMAQIAALLSMLEPTITGTGSPDRVVVPESRTALVLTTSLPADSQRIRVNWPSNGMVLGISATVAEGADKANAVGMNLEIDGVAGITVGISGGGGSFVPLSMFRSPDGGGMFLPMRKRVTSNQRWNVQYSVLRSVLASGSETFTPVVGFLFQAESEGPNR
jgi:hypothetical protein